MAPAIPKFVRKAWPTPQWFLNLEPGRQWRQWMKIWFAESANWSQKWFATTLYDILSQKPSNTWTPFARYLKKVPQSSHGQIRRTSQPNVCALINSLALQKLSSPGRKLMTAIISGFAFGQKIDVFANPDQSFILDALENYAWRMGIYKESPFLTYLQLEKAYAILSRGNTTKKWLRWGETYISGVLSSCKDVETGTFSAFVNSKSTITGEACTRGELSSEAFFLMLAGKCNWDHPWSKFFTQRYNRVWHLSNHC